METNNVFKMDDETGMLILPETENHCVLEEEVRHRMKFGPVYCLIGKTKLMFTRNKLNTLPFKIYDKDLNEIDYENYHFCVKINDIWISGFNKNYTITLKYISIIFETEEEIDNYISTLS